MRLHNVRMMGRNDQTGKVMYASEEKHEMIARIVSAYAGRPDVNADDIVALLARLTRELDAADNGRPELLDQPRPLKAEPAIPLEQAVTPDKVYCLCCGKGFKMLKRHLGAEHGLTEAEYRAMFDLPDDFPLVAPSYSEKKARYAKASGFGKHARSEPPQPARGVQTT